MSDADAESLNLDDLDIERLEERIELGHLLPAAAMPVQCANNSCNDFSSGNCSGNTCRGFCAGNSGW